MEKLIMVIYKTIEIAAHKVRTESDKYRRVNKSSQYISTFMM